MRLEDRLDRFFLGRIDEGAGVHDQDIGFVGVGGDLHPALEHAAEHERDAGNGDGHRRRRVRR